jgi:hypothetical protein
MMQQNGARSRAVWLVAAFGLAFGVAPVAALAKPQLTRDRLDLAAADPEAREKIGASVMQELQHYADGEGVTYPEETHVLTARA